RPHRSQRSLRRAGAGRWPGARVGLGSRQRQWRRDCVRPPDRRQRRAHPHHAALRDARSRRAHRHGDALFGRRQRRRAERGARQLMPNAAVLASRDRRIAVAGVFGFAVALAAASQVAIPIPGTAVPMTLQPLVVVLAGLWLGPRAGAASMVLYLFAGAAGLPVFAPFGAPGVLRLIGPTGGYIWAYPVAAWVAGMVAQRRAGIAWRTLAAALGILVLHVGGVAQLTLLTGSLSKAVMLGSLPFLGMDAVKALLAGALSTA